MVRSSLLLPLLAAASAVKAQLQASKIIPGAFIVELDDNEDASEAYASTNKDAVTRMNLNFTLFKGLSIQYNDLETANTKAAQLAQLRSVRNVWPVRTYSLPEVEVVWTGREGTDYVDVKRRELGNDTFSTHVMTQVDKLHRDGVTGKGIKVAIVDTGIDYGHPALGNGCFGAGCLVSYGYDLVGDNYTGLNTPVPDPDPIDTCVGHGTHVAGIIAAQENPYGFLGSAPGVTLGAYRVFGCNGTAGTDVLITAFNRAFDEGSQIITASIGGPSGWTDDAFSSAVSRIVDAGVPCTLSAGNSGDEGMFFSSSAAGGRHVTSVASFDNSAYPSLLVESAFTVDGGAPSNFSYTFGDPAEWSGIKLPLWAITTNSSSPIAQGCNPYPDGTPDLSGKIALIKRGNCTFEEKAELAVAAGAKYIMFYNAVPGAVSVDLSAAPGVVAAGMTTPDQGAAWLKAIAAGSEVVLHMTDPKAAPPSLISPPNTLTGGSVSSYSSWGPNWDAYQKPQFGAVGGNILSTFPRSKGSYAILSGTSMSCPQTAAIIALIAEVRKTLDPATIENLLSAHASPVKFNDGTGPGALLAPVAQQGGGLVQAYDAAHSKIILSHSSLAFNDTDHFTPELNFTIKNTGSAAVSFDLSNIGAGTAYTFAADDLVNPAPFPNELTDEYATLDFSESKVSVPAGGEATVLVSPKPPALDAARLPVWSGYIALNGSDGSSMSLPYMGIGGSLHSHATLNATLMSISTSADNEPVPEGYTYVLPPPGTANQTNAIVPVICVNMVLGSALVRADLVPLNVSSAVKTEEVLGTKTVGQPISFPYTYISRGLAVQNWDGQLANDSYVAPGTYKLSVKALRIFGDPSKVGEYDVLETQPFSLVYGAVNATAPINGTAPARH
ncbi:subtilase [Colletotrichum zoysiae]|uniref:Subtilase n=1 Tax=Colletotrichum zoysiae TaxID=1216348 RepID=A0AAD9HQN1_9PEZI|nr:subtilase [Colletotrichum zoysiae]